MERINTDSSDIKIIENSVYHIYEEEYKWKDSIWYSVHYIQDTTRLHSEGWKTKDRKNLGIWREHNFDGELMYTRDYENATCVVNEKLYPYHDLLKKMKLKADSLIISTYSQEFFDNHVRFNFNCYAYDKQGYIGSWTEPMEREPTQFLFRYSVKIGDSEWFPERIGIKLDSDGNYLVSRDFWNNYGFENVKAQRKTFQLDKLKAIEIAKLHGLRTTEPDKLSEFLKWEKFKQGRFFDGLFKYYLAELTDEERDIKENAWSTIVYKYNVYSFTPWTAEFIEKKKMKRVRRWDSDDEIFSDFIPDE